MGRAHRARDHKPGRDVALKILPPELSDDRKRRARLEREARAVAALNHPNIVTIYAIEEADGVLFLTMELVEGSPLTEFVAHGGLSLNRVLEIAIPRSDARRRRF